MPATDPILSVLRQNNNPDINYFERFVSLSVNHLSWIW